MRFLMMGWALLTLAGLLQKPATVFTVGVLRRDAFIVPFATYDGKQWRNYWPNPTENVDVPLTLGSVPRGWWGPAGPRETWQVWTADALPQLVKVRQPDWASSYCHKVVGLRTDYQPRFRPPPLSVNPYPKDGLAISPPHPLAPIEIIGPGASERDDVIEAIHARFAELERDMVEKLPRMHAENPRQFPEHPNERELLSMPPMTLEALYAYGTSRRTYYLEGAREYKRDGACTVVILARGIVVRQAGKFLTVRLRLGLTSCDRTNESYMLPFGVMSLPTGTYWIAQMAGWVREQYTIIDITPPRAKQPDLNVPGGGC
jgi:hypothetical protein